MAGSSLHVLQFKFHYDHEYPSMVVEEEVVLILVEPRETALN